MNFDLEKDMSFAKISSKIFNTLELPARTKVRDEER